MVKSAFMPLAILVAFGFYKSPIAQAQLFRDTTISTDWRYERDKWLGRDYDLLLETCDLNRKILNANGYSAYSTFAINSSRRSSIRSSRKRGMYLTDLQLAAQVNGIMKATRIACPDVW